jgi:hypothetical protein
MKKPIIISICIFIAIVSYPLAWHLFPWAQSMSATTMSDGTLVLLSPEDGAWIIKLAFGLTITSLISALAIGVWFKPKLNSK